MLVMMFSSQRLNLAFIALKRLYIDLHFRFNHFIIFTMRRLLLTFEGLEA